MIRILCCALAILVTACSSNPPLREYTLARTALSWARDQDAARHAPSYWHRAEEAYRSGEAHFRDSEYELAQEDFVRAREFAEKSENAARIQKRKSGGFSP